MLNKTHTRYGEMYYYANDQFIGASLQYYGEYTKLEIDYVSPYLKDDDIVIDIGANIGTHTLAYSSLVPKGQVLAFEPNKRSYDVLVKNVELNNLDNVHVFRSGLGNKVGLELVTDYDPSVQGNYGTMKTGEGNSLCFINKLDNVCNFNRPVKLVKIDVEGNEGEILLGGFNFIANHKPVIQYECMTKETARSCEYVFKNYFPKYKLYWMPIYNFNQHNHRSNSTNIFVNSGVMNILAVHSSQKQPDYLQAYESWDQQVTVRSEGLRMSYEQMMGGGG